MIFSAFDSFRPLIWIKGAWYEIFENEFTDYVHFSNQYIIQGENNWKFASLLKVIRENTDVNQLQQGTLLFTNL